MWKAIGSSFPSETGILRKGLLVIRGHTAASVLKGELMLC